MRPTLRLAFSRTTTNTGPSLRSRVYKLLQACGPNQPSRFMFAFSYHGLEAMYKGEWGWSFVDPLPELARLGICPSGGGAWRITHINKDYAICDTYHLSFVLLEKQKISLRTCIDGMKISSNTCGSSQCIRCRVKNGCQSQETRKSMSQLSFLSIIYSMLGSSSFMDPSSEQGINNKVFTTLKWCI